MCSRLPGALLIKSGLGCDESKTRTSDRNRERSDGACCAFLPTRTTESRKQSQKALKGRCSRRNVLSLGCPNARPIADVPWNNIPDDREFSRNTRNRDSTRKSSLQSRPGCSAKRSPSQLPSNQVLLGERGLGRGRRRPMDRSPGSRPVVQQPRSSSTNAASGAMWASCSCARRAARAPGLLKSLGLCSGSVIR